jgi:hypothetical protein
VASVLVSYRRGDASGYARRLSQELGHPQHGIDVLLDADRVVPGEDVVAAVDEAIERCEAVLAVIGPRWLTETDQHGRRELDLASDHVRIELEAAQRRGVMVIPVLVGGAAMPEAEELPAALQWLARRSPLELRDAFWQSDLEELRRTLRPVAVTPGGTGRPRRRGLWIAGAVLILALLGLAVAALLAAEDETGSTASSAATATPVTGDTGAAAEATSTSQQPGSSSASEPETSTETAPIDPGRLTDTLFEDDLTPPSDAFPDGPGADGCTFTSGESGYDVAAPADVTCTARQFLDVGDLPNAALTVTASLPAGVNTADPGTRVVVACSATRDSAYRATLAPDGVVTLVRHARTDRSLAKGAASGIDLATVPARLRLACTSGGGSTRIELSVDGTVVADATDADPLPAGQPTFGAARAGAGAPVALRFTDLRVEGPP